MIQRSKEEYRVLLNELEDVVSSKTEAAISARIELRDAVCRYVDAEQSNGISLAKIIETVKGILAKAEKDSANATPELAEQLVAWCTQFHGKRRAALC